MGTGWSKLSPEEIDVYGEPESGSKQIRGDVEEYFSGFAEVSVSPDQTIQTSQATTKASSSSIPGMFQRVDEYNGIAVGGEIELSELEGRELEEYADGFDEPVSKPHSPTMSPTSSSPIKAFLKVQEIEQLNASRRRKHIDPDHQSVSLSKAHEHHHHHQISSSTPVVVVAAAATAKRAKLADLVDQESKGHKEVQELLLPGCCLLSSQLSLLVPLPRFELPDTVEKTTTSQEQQQQNNNNNPSSSSRLHQFRSDDSDPFEATDPHNPTLGPHASPPPASSAAIKSSVLPLPPLLLPKEIKQKKIGTTTTSSMESAVTLKLGNSSCCQAPSFMTSAQKLLLFDCSNRKRKLAATQGLVSLVGDYLGGSANELNPPAALQQSSLERFIPSWSLS